MSRGIEQPVTISLREAYSGGVRIVTKGERKLRVNIPAGATDGTRIRLRVKAVQVRAAV